MRAPLSWLRDFVPLEASVDELTATLSNLGLVVEGVERAGMPLDGVVVARVLDQRRHPDADRIRLVDVDAGSGDALQVVCGATNLQVGDLVPLATVGARLPGGLEITRRKLRGQWSEGMLCAADELDLPANDGERGILVLPPDVAELGTPVVDVAALGIGPDVVFDLDVSANRPDALCMAGVARDLAAALDLPFAVPELAAPEGEWPAPPLAVEAPELCPKLTGTVITNLPRGPSPLWLARRIALAGMRPISAVVDATNYVMLDLGQPVHAYDLDRLGGGGLLVRRGRPGETMVTLDGVTRRLGPDDCVIADAEGTAVGIGGIMGGASSEVSEDTTMVLLEAAWFAPRAIARTGNRLGLLSEARSRFERGVDPEVTRPAVARFVSLLPGARPGRTAEVTGAGHLPAPRTMDVRVSRVNGLLGTDLDAGTVAGYLRRLGFGVAAGEDGPLREEGGLREEGRLRVTVPSWRPDTTQEVDAVEEVARLHGYDCVERTLPPGVRAGGGLTTYQKRRRRVRDILAGAGLSEAQTTTFLSADDLRRAEVRVSAVEVANPLDQAESLLRPSLLPGLLKAVRRNADRQLPDVRFFELGHTFGAPERPEGGDGAAGDAGDSLPRERERLAVVLAGAGADARLAVRVWAVLAGALRLDGVRLDAGASPGLHRSRSARLVGPAGEVVGVVGEVDPDVAERFGLAGRIGYLEADVETLLALPTRPEVAPVVSRFPASDVDLAFVVPGSVAAADVQAALTAGAGELLEEVRLFDVYPMPDRGPGTRSLAYHLRFRHPERTLTDDDVARLRQAAIDAVVGAHPAQLRG